MKTKTLLRIVNKIFVNDSDRPDRKYLFNLICLFAFLSAVLATFVNYFANVGFWAMLSSSILAVCYLVFYLIARTSKQLNIWMPSLFAGTSYPILIYLWFITAGHAGTMGYVLLAYVLAIICIFPKSHHIWWISLNMLVLLNLLVVEYLHPEWVIPYESPEAMLIDVGLTFLFIASFMALIIRTLVKGYSVEKIIALKEKSLAEQNNEVVIRQNQELQNVNLLKDRLFATISHDLRSPINSLKGTLALLQNNSLSEEELNKLTMSISERLSHTSNLLENLLSWSNSQMKGTNLNPKKVRVAPLVSACIDLYSSQAYQKHITIKNDVNPNHYFFADEDMLHSVIRNLLSNAIKFTRTDGVIVIHSWVKDDTTFLEVKDNGIGMDQAKVDKLFSLLHSSSEGTAMEKGIGLGLLISKDFVEKNGGEITVISQPEIGSAFTISLPAQNS